MATNSRSFASLRMTILDCGYFLLRLLRKSEALAVNFFQDNIAASAQERLAHFFAQANGIIAFAGFAEDFGSVGMSYQCVQVDASAFNFGKSSDRDLAPAT